MGPIAKRCPEGIAAGKIRLREKFARVREGPKIELPVKKTPLSRLLPRDRDHRHDGSDV